MEYFFPTELPSPPISTAKSLIVCCCHDKRLRVFRLLCDRFPQYLSLFSFFVVFRQNGRLFFVFLRNIPLPIEILKIKILEYSYPLSQYVNKAFIRFFSCRRKVALCPSGRMAHRTSIRLENMRNACAEKTLPRMVGMVFHASKVQGDPLRIQIWMFL